MVENVQQQQRGTEDELLNTEPANDAHLEVAGLHLANKTMNSD